MSSIVGRFLNYLLVPLYTAKISAASGGYGMITNIYAYTALLLVILTYGMETTFFRYANKTGEDVNKVYTTTLISVGFSSILFSVLVLGFLPSIAGVMGYSEHPDYIGVMAVCVAFDAFTAIPFAYLRYQKRPLKFAYLKIINIMMLIVLNLVYYIALPALYAKYPSVIGTIYNPNVGVGYVFYINLFCSVTMVLFLYRELFGLKYQFNWNLLKRMMSYSWPILILGIAGILNQTAGVILFRYVYKKPDVDMQLGIFGAASKIAMIMAMITQAFRYAYEPFVFGKSRDKDNRATYAKAMKFFIIFTLLAFLVVMAYMDILKHIIGHDYWAGLKVVPIVMAAAIMTGIYFNLSFWYKLIDKTIWGAYFSGIGCFVLVAINIIFIPNYGYMACAWSGFAGYAVAMLLSYFVGQKYYPINYPLKSIFAYTLLTIVLYALGELVPIHSVVLRLVFRTFLLFVFIAYMVKHDVALSEIPILNRLFKKR
ncbi:MAG: oligosaccharide flippase family protein [Bacteroidales bacterium]|nr:oligosaccharide flippase family protein [Bacteroidales bacterium]